MMIVKDKYKVALIAIIIGLFMVIFDTFVDHLAASKNEIFIDIFIFLTSFILLGIIISRFIVKHKKVEGALTESEKRYQMLFESADDAIFILDAEGKKAGRIVAANKAAADMHGYPVEELLNMSITDLDTPEAAKEAQNRIYRMLKGEKIKEEITHRKKDGTVFHVEISAGLLEIENHKYILAFDKNITERKSAEKALIENEEKYRSLIESTDDSIYLVDRDCEYLYMNGKHRKRMGFAENEYAGRAYGEFHSTEETKNFIEEVSNVFETGEPVQREHLSRRDNRYFLRTLSPVKDADGSIIAVTVVSKDVNDLKRLEEKLRTMSLTDELTGLYNRRGFFTMVEQLLKLAGRHKKKIYMLYADLDGLKEINDISGHQEGDKALIEAANIFKATFRESDIIARIGGDEFVVIPIENIVNSKEKILKRLYYNLEEFNAKKILSHRLSVSIGISLYDPEAPCSIDELLLHADKLMYEQKTLKRKS